MNHQQATIRINPNLEWPKLYDDDGQDVVQFLKKFHETCALGNNGQGMPDREKLIVFDNCLKGKSRNKVYQRVMRVHRGKLAATDPGKVITLIENKLLRFSETMPEKQARVGREFEQLYKGNRSTLEWELAWHDILDDLEESGLMRKPVELFHSYLRKIPPEQSQKISQDRRSRKILDDNYVETDKEEIRFPMTWEEAHDVALENDRVKQNHRALIQQYAYTGPHQQGGNQNWWVMSTFPDDATGKGKGKKGKGKGDGKGKGKGGGKGKDAKGAAKGKAKGGQTPGVCYRARDNSGVCDRPNCGFDHSPAALKAARTEIQNYNIIQKQYSQQFPAWGSGGSGKGSGGWNTPKGKGKGKKGGSPY